MSTDLRKTFQNLKKQEATQRNCYDCPDFITNIQLLTYRKQRADKGENPDESFPLDVDWKNCREGPDVFLNCTKRRGKQA
jgi:hypothetical protein